MQDSTKVCIVTGYAPNTSHGNFSHGSPYEKGQVRLLNSLIHHGYRHDVLAFQDFPNDHYDKTCGYNIKASCMHEARERGYDVLLWLDSSVWAIRAIEPLFDYIVTNGWYFHSNGFDLGLTMNDAALDYFEIESREKAFTMPDLSSSMFGLHLGNPKGEHALIDWLQSAKDGLWASSREPWEGEPKNNPGDRQDQSCLTAIMHKREMNMLERGHFSDIAKDNDNISGHDREIIDELIGLVDLLPDGDQRNRAIGLLNTLNGYSKDCIFVMRGM